MSTATASVAPSSPSPRGARWLRGIAWFFIGLIVLLIVLFLAVWYYTTTADFQRRTAAKIVSILEDSTGGRVELGHISFSLAHLAIEADGLVIHGTEGPGEAPYLSAAKIFVRLKMNTFLSHTIGVGPQSHVGVNYLRIEQPHVHLIVDNNGKTNQPVPKKPSTSTEPLQNTLLDLQAGKVELADGLAVFNDRAVPFDLAANKLDAEVHYISSADHYGATIDLNDLRTKMQAEPEVQSHLHITAELGRDMAALKSFEFTTGTTSHLSATALVQHFAKPEWQTDIQGSLELLQVGLLAGVDGLKGGTVDLSIHGRNCEVAPATAQKKPGFFLRRRPKGTSPQAIRMLPPDPECKSGYLLIGNAKMHNASFVNENVRVRDVNGGADLHITPTELLFTALTGYLPGGGSAEGDLRISNWLGEVHEAAPAASATTVAAAKTANNVAKGAGAKPVVKDVTLPSVSSAHAVLNVTLNRIPLRTIMAITATPGYGDLGLDTAVSGPVKAEWGGPAADISQTVQVDGDLKFTPTGVRVKNVRSNIAVSGEAKAHYDGRTQVVNIQNLNLRTPATTLAARGVLGVNKGDRLTALHVDLQARDLGEFDQLFTTLGLQANGKRGTAAIPVILHGQLSFSGTASGAVSNLDVKGHLNADNLALHFGSMADINIDSVVADGGYSPNSGVAVASSTIKRNTAVLNLAGAVRPRRVVSRRGIVSFVWDNGMGIDATAKLANAQAADLLDIAGQKDKIPVTGTVSVDFHATGALDRLNGGGNITLTNGAAYGENFETVSVDTMLHGDQVEASRFLVAAHGMQITGNGAYNIDSKHIRAHLQGNNLQLSKFDLVRKANPTADGVLTLNADADGTVDEPNLRADLKLAKIVVQGKPLGELNATAHSTGSTVFYDAHSTLVDARIDAQGQTSLKGNYDTQAKLTLTGLDIGKPLALFSTNSIKASSAINGVVTVSGPLKTPAALSGSAELNPVNVQLEGIDLRSAEPMRASLRDGVVTLDQMHITGQDTDIRIGGTARVFGDTHPLGGPVNLKATGSVSMALAHTFDRDIIASGKVTFDIAALGRMKQPDLTGNVQFVHVNVAIDGIANGLSDMNGSLVFNQNRLEVKDVIATTGGGKLRLGGFLSYQQRGIFADLTATGDKVRVRYNGLSATANAQLRLQGGPQSALLSGNVLITRFNVGQDVDFAAFAGSGGVAPPPDPNVPANKIRLDVHITSAPQLDFQNTYAKLAGTVDLTVRGTVAVPSILGTIRITDGSATFAGTTYQLQRGTIYFTNPVRIDPQIDLDATAKVSNYDITIGLHGTTTNLKPTYRSEPPLTEADIINLLALGRTQEEASLYQQQQLQAGTDPTTNAVLGGAFNATLGNRVGKLFGAGTVKIDPSYVGTLGSSSARITVSEPLSKQLTLVFATNVNQSAQQLIQVQYQLNESQSLVATRDENGVFSIVFKIRKRYR